MSARCSMDVRYMFDNCLIDIDSVLCKIKQVSIFYDLIPFLNPNLYLNNNPSFAKYYKEKLNGLKSLVALLAISKSSASPKPICV